MHSKFNHEVGIILTVEQIEVQEVQCYRATSGRAGVTNQVPQVPAPLELAAGGAVKRGEWKANGAIGVQGPRDQEEERALV